MATSPTLQQISECFIKPKHITNEIVHLTTWDLYEISVQYIQKGLLFTKTLIPIPIETLLEKLKDSLSIALCHFYSLAGQFETQVDEENHTSLIFIDCNKGPGAKFIHATLDVAISDILSTTYRPEVVKLLFDHNDALNHDGHTRSLLTVQVTELIDGVFIACSINHACVDGASFWHFVSTFSEIFMADGDEKTPISRPPVYKPWFLDGSGPVKLPYTKPEEFMNRYEIPTYKERVFHFSASSIAKLKAKANSDCGTTNRISSFQALAALTWRCITRARSLPDDKHTRCGLAINNRGRLSPPLPQDYFGNSLDLIPVIVTAGELLRRSLGWAAMLLNEVVVSHTDKKVRAIVKRWMEHPWILPVGAHPDPSTVFFGSSPRFDMYGPEFGMGKALAVVNGKGGYFDGKVTCSPGRDEEGSVDMEVRLYADSMSALERDDEFVEFVSLFV